MIQSLCNTCLQPFEILVETKEIDLIRQISDDVGHTCACPRLCGGRINIVNDSTISKMGKDPRLKRPLQISGKELYAAVNGLGLPDEIPKTLDTVKAVLGSGKVLSFELHETMGRIYLSEIRMTDGVVVHLTSGPHGAQVLKMTKERTNVPGNPR